MEHDSQPEAYCVHVWIRVNPANPNVDIVSFGLRIVFHDAAQPIRWTTPRLFLAPGLKCSPSISTCLPGATTFLRCLIGINKRVWNIPSVGGELVLCLRFIEKKSELRCRFQLIRRLDGAYSNTLLSLAVARARRHLLANA